jgi:hypothetical protein
MSQKEYSYSQPRV